MLLKTDLDSIYLNTVCHSPWHRMNNVPRVSIAILIYNDLPKDTYLFSDSFGLQQPFCFPKQYSLPQNHRVSCQTLQTSPFCTSIWETPVSLSSPFMGLHCLSVRWPKQASTWIIHFDKGSWEGWHAWIQYDPAASHSFLWTYGSLSFKMKSSKNPETKPSIS